MCWPDGGGTLSPNSSLRPAAYSALALPAVDWWEVWSPDASSRLGNQTPPSPDLPRVCYLLTLHLPKKIKNKTIRKVSKKFLFVQHCMDSLLRNYDD